VAQRGTFRASSMPRIYIRIGMSSWSDWSSNKENPIAVGEE